jgi:hypothetical protein
MEAGMRFDRDREIFNHRMELEGDLFGALKASWGVSAVFVLVVLLFAVAAVGSRQFTPDQVDAQFATPMPE